MAVQCGLGWLGWERQLSLDSKPERWRWGYSVGRSLDSKPGGGGGRWGWGGWGGKGSCLWTRSLRGGGGGTVWAGAAEVGKAAVFGLKPERWRWGTVWAGVVGVGKAAVFGLEA